MAFGYNFIQVFFGEGDEQSQPIDIGEGTLVGAVFSDSWDEGNLRVGLLTPFGLQVLYTNDEQEVSILAGPDVSISLDVSTFMCVKQFRLLLGGEASADSVMYLITRD